MIDPDNEELLTLNEASRLRALRTRNTKPSPATLWRWRNRGSLSTGGERVKLETIKLPGGVFTTREAVSRFITGLNGSSAPTNNRREKSIDAAQAELAAAGIS